MNQRIKLLLILGMFALPVVASYLAYYIWQPTGRKNYGELVKQADIKLKGVALNGEVFDIESLKGKWVMVYVGGGECPKTCQDLLYAIRQIRTIQGKEMDRIERLWVITDDRIPNEDMQKMHAGLFYLRTDQANAAQFPGSETAGHLYMVDPLGHLMMRWPQNPEPKQMIKDVKLLLKASQIG